MTRHLLVPDDAEQSSRPDALGLRDASLDDVLTWMWVHRDEIAARGGMYQLGYESGRRDLEREIEMRDRRIAELAPLGALAEQVQLHLDELGVPHMREEVDRVLPLDIEERLTLLAKQRDDAQERVLMLERENRHLRMSSTEF